MDSQLGLHSKTTSVSNKTRENSPYRSPATPRRHNHFNHTGTLVHGAARANNNSSMANRWHSLDSVSRPVLARGVNQALAMKNGKINNSNKNNNVGNPNSFMLHPQPNIVTAQQPRGKSSNNSGVNAKLTDKKPLTRLIGKKQPVAAR